ncbi:MAG: hypothetical protein ACYCO4_01390 [Sulfobacillus sp.]
MLASAVEKSLRQAYPQLVSGDQPVGLDALMAQAAAVRSGTFQLICQSPEAEEGPASVVAAWTASDQGGKLPVSGRGDSAEEAIAAWLLARLTVGGWSR